MNITITDNSRAYELQWSRLSLSTLKRVILILINPACRSHNWKISLSGIDHGEVLNMLFHHAEQEG